jgi:hypothetical protein
MQFMFIVKGSKFSEAGVMPSEAQMAEMATFHEAMAKAGVLLDASGLHPSSKGVRIKYSGGKKTIIDGPFTEAKELIAGFSIIQVKTREDALEWARRFPAPQPDGEGEIEIRQIIELADLEPSESVERFKQLEANKK